MKSNYRHFTTSAEAYMRQVVNADYAAIERRIMALNGCAGTRTPSHAFVLGERVRTCRSVPGRDIGRPGPRRRPGDACCYPGPGVRGLDN